MDFIGVFTIIWAVVITGLTIACIIGILFYNKRK